VIDAVSVDHQGNVDLAIASNAIISG